MSSAKLPSLDHATLEDWENVYEPAEDTFLLCDALLADKDEILQSKPYLMLEIGCGSGCVITYLHNLLKDCGWKGLSLATDINSKAASLASKTARENGADVEIVQTRFTDGLDQSLQNAVDVLICNPPYVPTPDDEVDYGIIGISNGGGIAAAWAGGENGRKVIDLFLPKIKTLLRPGGRCYLVLVSDNKPAEISRILAADGLTCSVASKRRAKNESLTIMRIVKPSTS